MWEVGPEVSEGRLDGRTELHSTHLQFSLASLGGCYRLKLALLSCLTISLETPVGVRNGHLWLQWMVEVDISSGPSVGTSWMCRILHFHLIARNDDIGF